jgi:pimeloyl-ACP methyl ester carboxylesterase
VAREVQVGFRFHARKRDRLVLLIHGYNVREAEADPTFHAFAEKLRLRAALRGKIGYLSWPGNFSDRLKSSLSYLQQVRNADQCGPKLAQFLAYHGSAELGNPEIILIAHSLGCRVALKTAEALPVAIQKRLTLILMAAAYPVDEIGAAMRKTIAHSRYTAVLHSRADSVLRTIFPVAETSRTRFRTLPQAIGLRGRPYMGVWHCRSDIRPLDHGDYWTSEAVRQKVDEVLGSPLKRMLPTLRSQSNRLPTRIPLQRTLRARALPRNEL